MLIIFAKTCGAIASFFHSMSLWAWRKSINKEFDDRKAELTLGEEKLEELGYSIVDGRIYRNP